MEYNRTGYRAGRVRTIFKLPPHLIDSYPHPLVYLDLFSPFPKALAISHGMYTTSHDEYRGVRRTLVIPIAWVVSACHLAPVFGQFPRSFPFERHDALSVGKNFYFRVNHYSSHFIFGLVEHWRASKAKADRDKAIRLQEVAHKAAQAKAIRAKALHARLVHARMELDNTTEGSR